MTPGKHEKSSLAGALQRATGKRRHCLGPRPPPGLWRALLTRVAHTSPAPPPSAMGWWITPVGIKPKPSSSGWPATRAVRGAGSPCLAPAPPLARACGKVHDKCPRSPKRTR
jgi:hypothetical protein